MESITIFLRDFGYFNAGALVGGAIIFLFACLAFSGPLWMQQKDINRLNEDKKAANKKIDYLENEIETADKMKMTALANMHAEEKRAALLEAANQELQGEINDLLERYNKIYVELDALKAQYFQKKTEKVA